MKDWNIIKKLVGISEATNKKVREKMEEVYNKLIEEYPNIPTDDLIAKLKVVKSELLTDPGFVAAGAAEDFFDPEAFRRISYDDLPADVKAQLRRDGTRGDLRTEAEAEDLYENDIPAEAKGSVEGVKSITNDPEIEWSHTKARSNGGSDTHENGGYAHAENNPKGGPEATRTRTAQEVESDFKDMEVVAETNTPGVSGDLGEVIGEVADCGVGGAGIGAGMGAVNRLVQAKAFRDAGRDDLARHAEAKVAEDALKGAGRGLKAGIGVAAVQAVVGANPLTAGIGIVAGDSVEYLMKKDSMSESEKEEAVVKIVGKGAVATTLACVGPPGWIALAGWGVLNAYTSAQNKAGEGGTPTAV